MVSVCGFHEVKRFAHMGSNPHPMTRTFPVPTPPANTSLAAQMGDSPAPLYARVKQMIAQQIQNGTWAPHHRVPSESELVTQLGFSRMTINRALRELTAEGLLVRMQGVGTFVAEPKSQSALFEVHNIADEIALAAIVTPARSSSSTKKRRVP